MRHKKHLYKLGVSPSHRKAMMKNLATSLILSGKIKSTSTRCKALRPYLEKLVTVARKDTVENRRLVFSKLESKEAVKQLFSEVAPKYVDRNGGYLRITKLADRRVGDSAPMSFISFV